MAVLLAAAAAAVCMAAIPNPKPHAIRDANDAITTALANKWAADPGMAALYTPKDLALQKSIYEAKREGALWHLIPHPRGGRRGEGCHYWVDAKTGCITENMCVN